MAKDRWLRLSLRRLFELAGDRLGERKLRLLACAAVRRLPGSGRSSFAQTVDLAERFADGKASAHELAARRFAGRFQPGDPAWAVCWDPHEPARAMAERALAWVAGLGGASGSHLIGREEEAQADLFREVATHLLLGDTFDPAWCAFDGGIVAQLAGGIYEDRAYDRMPVLGDALEEAGCTSKEILEHCRQDPAVHVRGCWVVDLCLDKK
jgi:hypothetical protein